VDRSCKYVDYAVDSRQEVFGWGLANPRRNRKKTSILRNDTDFNNELSN
jgi:hypothetical protein